MAKSILMGRGGAARRGAARSQSLTPHLIPQQIHPHLPPPISLTQSHNPSSDLAPISPSRDTHTHTHTLPHTHPSTMARSVGGTPRAKNRTARKSTGGKAPRKNVNMNREAGPVLQPVVGE